MSAPDCNLCVRSYYTATFGHRCAERLSSATCGEKYRVASLLVKVAKARLPRFDMRKVRKAIRERRVA